MNDIERERIGLRMFSEGIELNLSIEERKEGLDNTKTWTQDTKCPHCNKNIRIWKWIEKWKAIVF